MLEAGVWGVLLVVGFGYALWQLVSTSARERLTVTPLALLVMGVYLWYGLSTLALAMGTTLLAFRMESLLLVALGTAGVLGLRRVWQLSTTRWDPWLRPRASAVAATAAVMAVVSGVAVLQENAHHLEGELEAAYADPYPSGPNARGVVRDGLAERWVDELAIAIDAHTDRPADELVVLTTNYSLLGTHPYRGFQQSSPHYANPLAGYSERATFIEHLAQSSSKAEFQDRLSSSPWSPPNVFVLRPLDDGLHLELHSDTFPVNSNVAFHDVVFDPEVFAGWSRQDVGFYTVLVQPGT